MQIGILGTGRMGVRLAAMFAEAGHAVVLGSRDLKRAKRIASGLRRTNITAGSYEEAAKAAQLSVHTVEKYVTEARARLKLMTWDR